MVLYIPTYIINLKSRPDRKEYVIKEFAGREEFDITIVKAIEHEIGAIGLWETIKKIVKEATDKNLDYILLCEDDHKFTKHYSEQTFRHHIAEAIERKADLLVGGVNWFEDAVQVSQNLFWVNIYNGNQFIVIFKKFFEKILAADFSENDTADFKMSALSPNKYFIYPFISVQKEFGHSDATPKNNGTYRMGRLFANTAKQAETLKDTRLFYNKFPANSIMFDSEEIKNINISAYVILSSEKPEYGEHIQKQFEGKPEFDVHVVENYYSIVGSTGLWRTIRKIIQQAIDNDDDAIVICEEEHEFTADYSKEYFFANIIEAGGQECNYLAGNCGRFEFAVPVSENRFWANNCGSSKFIVLYRKFFQTIVNAPIDKAIDGIAELAQLTGNKMILYPFISKKKDFVQTDIVAKNGKAATESDFFLQSAKRLGTYQDVYKKYVATTDTSKWLKVINTLLNYKNVSNKIVQSLWIGCSLSKMEQLCIQSFLQNGHEFHLYTYEDVQNIPEGTIVMDANTILPSNTIFYDSRSGIAAFSDWFRYKLLYDKGGWWTDMDMICIKAFDFENDFCFSTEGDPHGGFFVTTGIIKSAPKTEFLSDILDYIDSTGFHNVQWGEFGPKLLGDILKNYESVPYIQSHQTFCPIDWFNIHQLISKFDFIAPENTYTVHFWNERWRIIQLDKNAIYHPDSVYEKLKRQCGIEKIISKH